MTPELHQRLTDHIEALTAFRDGTAKEFEFWDGDEWLPTDDVLESSEPTSLWHRIKRQPKFRPFNLEEAPAQVGKVVQLKDNALFRSLIIGNYSGGCEVPGESVSYEELFKRYVFLDGSPCGVVDGE